MRWASLGLGEGASKAGEPMKEKQQETARVWVVQGSRVETWPQTQLSGDIGSKVCISKCLGNLEVEEISKLTFFCDSRYLT